MESFFKDGRVDWLNILLDVSNLSSDLSSISLPGDRDLGDSHADALSL